MYVTKEKKALLDKARAKILGVIKRYGPMSKSEITVKTQMIDKVSRETILTNLILSNSIEKVFEPIYVKRTLEIYKVAK